MTSVSITELEDDSRSSSQSEHSECLDVVKQLPILIKNAEEEPQAEFDLDLSPPPISVLQEKPTEDGFNFDRLSSLLRLHHQPIPKPVQKPKVRSVIPPNYYYPPNYHTSRLSLEKKLRQNRAQRAPK